MRRWLESKGRAKIIQNVNDLHHMHSTRSTGGRQRRSGFGSGIKPYLPSLSKAFVVALGTALVAERKKIHLSICLNTFRSVDEKVYPTGLAHPEVASYVKAFHGKEFTYQKNGKQIRFHSHATALPGKKMLKRVLDDGFYALKRSGAGKQREDVLDGGSDVWDKSVAFYQSVITNKKILLDHVLDIGEICFFCCGHIGRVKHTLRLQPLLVDKASVKLRVSARQNDI